MKYRIKSTATTLKLIAAQQIFWGLMGLWLIASILLKTSALNGAVLFILLLALSFYIISINAGLMLLNKSRIKVGLIYSMAINLFQMIAFGIGDFVFEFASGVYAIIGLDLTNGLEWKMAATLSNFNMYIGKEDPVYFFKLNLVAVIVLAVLINIYEEIIKKEKTLLLNQNYDRGLGI